MLPALEVISGGGLMPPEPITALWSEVLGEAAAWWSDRSGIALAPDNLACSNLHLVAWSKLRSDGHREAQLSGWWGGASPALRNALATATQRWPDHRLDEAEGLVRMSSGAPAVAPTPCPPGLRVIIHGDALMAEWAGGQPLGNGLLPFLRGLGERISATTLEATVSPQGHGEITMNWRTLGFVAPDARITAKLPRRAIATMVLAFDSSLLPVFVPISGWLRRYWEIDDDISNEDMLAGLSGTWAMSLIDDEHAFITMPVSRLTDRWCAKLVEDDGFKARRWQGQWVVASDDALLDQWQAGTLVAADVGNGAVHAWRPASSILIAIDAGRLMAQLSADTLDPRLTSILLNHLPLPFRLRGLGAWKPVAPVTSPAFGELAKAIAGAGMQYFELATEEQRLVVHLDGTLLPWLLPGVAVRWFSGYAEDQEGRILLRRTLAELNRSGAGSAPSDLLAGQPELTPTAVDSAMQAFAAITAGMPKELPKIATRLAREGLPLAPTADSAAELALCREVVARTAGLDALPIAAAVMLRQAQQQGRLDAARTFPLNEELHRMGQAARFLAAFNDPQALPSIERVMRHARHPAGIAEGLVWCGLSTMRDYSYLELLVGGRAETGLLDAWLHGPWDPPSQEMWKGERLIMLGTIAESWLDQLPVSSANAGATKGYAASSVFTPHQHRAWTAGDCAAEFDHYQALELGQGALYAGPPIRSLDLGLLTQTLPLVEKMVAFETVRHALVRAAARTWLLVARGARPANAAAWAQSLGPLAIETGSTRIPLVFEPRGTRGFRLAVDLSGGPPAGLPAAEWQRWQAAKPTAPGTRFAVNGVHMEVVIDLEATGPTEAKAPEAAGLIP